MRIFYNFSCDKRSFRHFMVHFWCWKEIKFYWWLTFYSKTIIITQININENNISNTSNLIYDYKLCILKYVIPSPGPLMKVNTLYGGKMAEWRIQRKGGRNIVTKKVTLPFMRSGSKRKPFWTCMEFNCYFVCCI